MLAFLFVAERAWTDLGNGKHKFLHLFIHGFCALLWEQDQVSQAVSVLKVP